MSDYTPEQVRAIALSIPLAERTLQLMDVLDQAARDARLRRGVEQLSKKMHASHYYTDGKFAEKLDALLADLATET